MSYEFFSSVSDPVFLWSVARGTSYPPIHYSFTWFIIRRKCSFLLYKQCCMPERSVKYKGTKTWKTELHSCVCINLFCLLDIVLVKISLRISSCSVIQLCILQFIGILQHKVRNPIVIVFFCKSYKR